MGIPAAMLPHTVTRIRPTESTNTYGDTVLTYASGTSMAAWVQQDQRDEPITDGRDPAIGVWLLITNESDIAACDRVTWGSYTFEVEGPPKPVYTPAGYHHTESTLRVVEG